jgi:hypothetical protein
MKLKLLFIIILFCVKESYSQNKEWFLYDLDSIVSIEMPFIVYEIDTIIDYNKFHQMYSENETSQFSAQKLYFGKLYSNIDTPTLPNNKRGLNKYYADIIEIFDQMISYNLEYKKAIKLSNLDGYKLSFNNSKDVNVQETYLYFVNKNLYYFSYINKKGIDKTDKDIFFNSIVFSTKKKLLQYPAKTISFKKKVIFTLLFILFLSFILRFKNLRKKQVN